MPATFYPCASVFIRGFNSLASPARRISARSRDLPSFTRLPWSLGVVRDLRASPSRYPTNPSIAGVPETIRVGLSDDSFIVERHLIEVVTLFRRSRPPQSSTATATRTQLRAIRAALVAIDRAIARDEAAINEDFVLHAAISDATGNPFFRRFLNFLGHFIISRASVRIRAANLRAYPATFQAEHCTIVAAIEARSVRQAQTAMRAHPLNSRERYRALAPDDTSRHPDRPTVARRHTLPHCRADAAKR
jgi:hypothetical protein